MKSVNLISLLNIHHNVNPNEFRRFKKFYGFSSIKDHEVNCIEGLLAQLGKYDVPLYDRFYVGYQIPHIGKEFDLLRFGKNTLINIELKTNAPKKVILEQLCKNKYYLNYLKGKKYYFCYVNKANILYKLSENNKLESAKYKDLLKLLEQQQTYQINNVDHLFEPANYLVSPFNAVDKFLNQYYFLTCHQLDIQKHIVKAATQSQEQNDEAKIFAITGEYGTGKSLLTYHIAKRILELKKHLLIIHCGPLNHGHLELNQHGFHIISINQVTPQHIQSNSFVIVDEAQRLTKNPAKGEMSLKEILNRVKRTNSFGLFSYDKNQSLNHLEYGEEIESQLSQWANVITYKLTTKVRTNHDIAEFIKCLFDKKEKALLSNKAVIDFIYCSEADAGQYLEYLNRNWQTIQYLAQSSSSNQQLQEQIQHMHIQNSYEVLGQEFDNVAIFIDKNFKYAPTGKLIYQGDSTQDEVRCLYQNITRVRKHLKIVIIENKDILWRCLEVLGK